MRPMLYCKNSSWFIPGGEVRSYLPLLRGTRRPEKANCLAFSAECLRRLPPQGGTARNERWMRWWFGRIHPIRQTQSFLPTGRTVSVRSQGRKLGGARNRSFPYEGHEAPGKSQLLGFFSRVPEALAASGRDREERAVDEVVKKLEFT